MIIELVPLPFVIIFGIRLPGVTGEPISLICDLNLRWPEAWRLLDLTLLMSFVSLWLREIPGSLTEPISIIYWSVMCKFEGARIGGPGFRL